MYQIAICDDEQTICGMVCSVIRKWNPDIKISCFDSGEALLAAYDSFDAIFLDIDMKGMDGVETGRQIRERDHVTRIIYLTAYRDYVAGAFEVHAFQYLLKPISASRLQQVLEEHYMESRKVIHDIRNHLQMLEQSQKFAESRAYVADMHQMLNALGMAYYTDNRMLNIILNNKLKLLDQEQFRCSLRGVCLDFLSDMDTTTIFANLLDNALEEAKENGHFSLEIQGEQIQDFCVIKMSNTTNGTYTPGKSSKTGHEGIGLENVQSAVGKYHGEMQTSQKGDVFSVTLLFPDNR